MRAHVYICDQCGAQRKDGNHWYGQLPNVSTFIAYKWDQVLELEKSGIEVKHSCGCVECPNCRSTPNPLPGCTQHKEPCNCKRIAKGQRKPQVIAAKKVSASPYTREFGMWLQRNFDRLLADLEVFKR